LKVLQESIKNVGGTLAALVSEKARAVDDEDYDKAARLKEEVSRIRSMLATQLSAAGIRYTGGEVGGGGIDALGDRSTFHDNGGHAGAIVDSTSPRRGGGGGSERAIRPAADGASLYSQVCRQFR
jgi:hypothetical protein